MQPITIVATATKELPIAEHVVTEHLASHGRLVVVPLPSHSLKDMKQLPPWYDDLIQADALFVRSGTVDKWLIKKLTKCKVIALHGAGVDQVDVSACTLQGVKVTNVPGGNAQAVAELTMALILDALRKVCLANRHMHKGEWHSGRHLGHELGSRKIGILGLGHTGRKVAALCQAFGAKVRYFDTDHTRADDLALTYMSFGDLVKWADILSIHVPLTSKTHRLIDAQVLSALGPQGILINVSRGPVVDTKALTQFLLEGKIAWAACDVFDTEPPDFTDKLFSVPNATFTPHIAGSTYQCLETIAKVATQDILSICTGGEARNAVN